MQAMEPEEWRVFVALVTVLREELEAQFAMERRHQTVEEQEAFAVLLADRVLSGFSLELRPPRSSS